jgi:hypothetical protein
MAVITFPSSPALNQTYSIGSKTWVWNGYAWDLQTSTIVLLDTFARNQANAAFISANTIQTYVTSANANISLLQSYVTTANSNITAAFAAANAATATDTTQNNSITAAFIAANSAGVYANGAFAAANLRATTANASIAWNTANAAFVRANNSLDANNGGTVTGTITATAFITTGSFGNITGANTIYANNFVANTGFIQFSDGSKQYTANAGSGGGTTDQVARDTANAAFIKANTGTSGANSFGQIIANVGTILATSSNDSLQIVGESGISVSSNVSAKKIIISVPAGFTFTTADYGFVTDSTNVIYDYGTI